MFTITIDTNAPLHVPGYSAVRCVIAGLAIGQGETADDAVLTASNITYALHNTDTVTETIGNADVTITTTPEDMKDLLAATGGNVL